MYTHGQTIIYVISWKHGKSISGKFILIETIEQFLKRGGKIERLGKPDPPLSPQAIKVRGTMIRMLNRQTGDIYKDPGCLKIGRAGSGS